MDEPLNPIEGGGCWVWKAPVLPIPRTRRMPLSNFMLEIIAIVNDFLLAKIIVILVIASSILNAS